MKSKTNNNSKSIATPFYGVDINLDKKSGHKLTYTLSEEERLKIFANLFIDAILKAKKEGRLKSDV